MNADSVKGRLKNEAVRSGRSFQDVLLSYGLERAIYRVSISEYNEKFTLKGGILLYALYDGNYPRATVDIDFLARNIGNDINSIKTVFKDIFSMTTDEDPLVFDLQSMLVSDIANLKKYHGVRVSITAFLDRTRIPISIDIAFGDAVFPERTLIEFPTLLSNKTPKIFAYSLYTSLAEKFEAIVSLGYDNSRFKDFYDIYVNVTQ